MVKSDLFSIVARLKELDSGYFVRFVPSSGRYEIHNSSNFGDTYCFCADKLDARVIVKARRTASSRIEKLIKEMDKENDLTLKRESSSIAKRIENSVEQALRKGG